MNNRTATAASRREAYRVRAMIERVNADSEKQRERMEQIARAQNCKIVCDDECEDERVLLSPHQIHTMLSAAYQSGREHERVQPLAEVVSGKKGWRR